MFLSTWNMNHQPLFILTLDHEKKPACAVCLVTYLTIIAHFVGVSVAWIALGSMTLIVWQKGCTGPGTATNGPQTISSPCEIHDDKHAKHRITQLVLYRQPCWLHDIEKLSAILAFELILWVTCEYHHRGPVIAVLCFLLLTWTSFWASNKLECDLKRHDTHKTSL